MATISAQQAPTPPVAAEQGLQELAKRYLWMHFTRMGGYADSDVPIIVRGDGCYLEDANGKRYLDALVQTHRLPREGTASMDDCARVLAGNGAPNRGAAVTWDRESIKVVAG